MSTPISERGIPVLITPSCSACLRCLDLRVQTYYSQASELLRTPTNNSEKVSRALQKIGEALEISGACTDPYDPNGVICVNQELKAAAELAKLSSKFLPGSSEAKGLAYFLASVSTLQEEPIQSSFEMNMMIKS